MAKMANPEADMFRQASATPLTKKSFSVVAILISVVALFFLASTGSVSAQTPADADAPTLVDFTFSPKTIDTSEGDAVVIATVELSDPGTGVCLSSCSDTSSPTQVRFEHPETGQFQDGLFVLGSGNLNGGTFRSEITFPEGSANDTWKVRHLLAADNVGNRRYYSETYLSDRGMATELLKNSSVNITTPVTGAGVNPGITPTPAPEIVIATTDNVTGISVDDTEPSGHKAYTRFQVRQTAKQHLAGNLLVRGETFESSIPYSASANEHFDPILSLPEVTGQYYLELTSIGRDAPILWLEGDLQRVGDGKYRHQFMNGDADPEVLELDPDESGMVLSLGSVKATLNSCIEMFSPIDAVFDIGVDTDGSGVIEPLELVTSAIQGKSSACVNTPESNIPLVSLYKAQVVTDQGSVVAENSGLYDFLTKSSIDSNKHAVPDLVREFKVQWVRTPVATSVEILNSSLRPQAVQVTALPQVEEVTDDIIQNASDEPGDDSGTTNVASGEASDSDATDKGNFLVEYWVWLALGIGAIAVVFMVVRTALSTESVSYRST